MKKIYFITAVLFIYINIYNYLDPWTSNWLELNLSIVLTFFLLVGLRSFFLWIWRKGNQGVWITPPDDE